MDVAYHELFEVHLLLKVLGSSASPGTAHLHPRQQPAPTPADVQLCGWLGSQIRTFMWLGLLKVRRERLQRAYVLCFHQQML